MINVDSNRFEEIADKQFNEHRDIVNERGFSQGDRILFFAADARAELIGIALLDRRRYLASHLVSR